jgi:hypothetical protein
MNQQVELEDAMPKARRARKINLSEMTVRAPKANLGVMAYGRGKMIHGHQHAGIPKHIIKAVEARRKHTLTGMR